VSLAVREVAPALDADFAIAYSALGLAMTAPSRPAPSATIPSPPTGSHELQDGAHSPPSCDSGALSHRTKETSAASTSPVVGIASLNEPFDIPGNTRDEPQNNGDSASLGSGSASNTAPAEQPTATTEHDSTLQTDGSPDEGYRHQAGSVVAQRNTADRPRRRAAQAPPNPATSRLRIESPEFANQTLAAKASEARQTVPNASGAPQNAVGSTPLYPSSIPVSSETAAGKRKASPDEDVEQPSSKRRMLAGRVAVPTPSPQTSPAPSPSSLSVFSPYPSTGYSTSTRTTPDPELVLDVAPRLSAATHTLAATHCASSAATVIEKTEDKDAEGEEHDENEDGFEILQTISGSSVSDLTLPVLSTIQLEATASVRVVISAVEKEEPAAECEASDAHQLELLEDIFDIGAGCSDEEWVGHDLQLATANFYAGGIVSSIPVAPQQDGLRTPPAWERLTDMSFGLY
jgi:hypothetical protein